MCNALAKTDNPNYVFTVNDSLNYNCFTNIAHFDELFRTEITSKYLVNLNIYWQHRNFHLGNFRTCTGIGIEVCKSRVVFSLVQHRMVLYIEISAMTSFRN